MLGDNLLPLLTLAMGGALLVGNVTALIRPRPEQVDGELDQPIWWRSAIQITIGLTVSIWALASLF